MSPVQYLRALIDLILIPPLTFAVCSLALIDLIYIRKSETKAQAFPRFWGRVLCRIAGIRVRIEGLENIDPNKTYIFAGNHCSQADIYAFQGYFPHDFRWIAKKELFRIPLFGHAMRRSGFVAMDRSRGREALKSLNQAAEQIAAGTSVIIFPEGTRSPDGRLQPFKTGAALLAIKSGVPVVPIGFNGTHRVLPKHKLLARSGDVVLRIGKPIPTIDFKPKDKQILAKRLHDEVARLLDPEQQPVEETGAH
ncbi:1-acyl-sn-glycerol-3-phosphate acyltransferase [Desulfolithobacter dissulfuricans]|uniref:1-acyl-sn-glycerol-3-phosphate acyltransferase n=1 Tax=Desulfolithobacter dissulfuricans TaxID=2795293 RepID=A0A915U3Y4_9BACT|nr:lysophospholipid acyltransferase family protein [Desulfolithobacter dissulfuricans]BCO10863.1 1-acyl-sn-glycerol-3-phosphate acyltransferase [Desulfolithobacter dissulfuricans]